MNLKDQKSQPHNDGSVNTDNSEVRAGGVLRARLDTAAAGGGSPLASEGAAIGGGRLPPHPPTRQCASLRAACGPWRANVTRVRP